MNLSEQLDADREGTHVLEAVNKSSLRITGNSTCLMPWDSRLGFTHKPFISALRSLSPDGGNIPLLDIRISKVFPLAYISSEKGKGTSPWSSEEEYKLQDEWNERYMQERSRLQAESEVSCGSFIVS
jgi:breast cancer 2 susceptibility protein